MLVFRCALALRADRQAQLRPEHGGGDLVLRIALPAHAVALVTLER